MSSCIIDTVPTPEVHGSGDYLPIPTGDNAGALPGLPQGALFYTRDGGGTALLVAGIRASVPATAVVGVDNLDTYSVARRRAAPDGSFSLFIDAAVGDRLRVTYWLGAAAAGTEQLTVVAASATTIEVGPSGGPSALSASTCGGGTSACVSGAAGAATPGLTVVVVNTSGAATSALAAADGSFSATVLARSGDELMVFAVPPGSQSGGVTQILTAP